MNSPVTMSLKQVPRYVGMVLMTCMIGYVLKPSGLAGAEVGRLLGSVCLSWANDCFPIFSHDFSPDCFPMMIMRMFWNEDCLLGKGLFPMMILPIFPQIVSPWWCFGMMLVRMSWMFSPKWLEWWCYRILIPSGYWLMMFVMMLVMNLSNVSIPCGHPPKLVIIFKI